MRLWTTRSRAGADGLCSRLRQTKAGNEEYTFDLSKEFSWTFTLEPIKIEQQIQVIGTASGGVVDAYIYLQKNKTKAQN